MATIDYSALQSTDVSQSQQEWEPPQHKFFGRRLPNGRMEPEPVYRYQPFPAFRYCKVGENIQARLVTSEAEARTLGAEWKDSPAEFGFVGAPTHEQARAAKLAEVEPESPRRGRPPKE